MKSPSTSRRASLPQGFTLMEVVVVIALFGFLLAFGLFVGMDVFRGTAFRSGRATLVSALTLARGRALANMHQSPHGVCYLGPDLIVFRGSAYDEDAEENEIIPGDPSVTYVSEDDFLSCDEEGVVFDQLSAETVGGEIVVKGEGHADEVVTVNEEGAILW